jgi:hypothetical protein
MMRASFPLRVFWLIALPVLVGLGCALSGGDKLSTPTDTPKVEVPVSDEAVLEAMQVIEGRVSEMRGLETLESVDKALLSTDELRTKLDAEMAEDYTEREARDDALLYAAFELMDKDVDLYALLLDLQTEQVAGFYDPDTQEMYVVKSGQQPGALERSTYSHEYTHVLQDQHFDLQALGFTDEDDGEEEDSEKQLAVRSLVEGDASLLQQQYMLQYFEMSDIQELLDQINAVDSSVLDSAPEVVRASLLFPYEAGLKFVTELFADGGWEAVDAAYANPPLSSEQILHPERYPGDAPQIVALPPLTDTLGSGWRRVDEDVMGEFGLGLYLDVHVSQADAETAAQGWGGDRYAVYWRDDESAFVLVLRLAWDTPADAGEFFETYADFAQARFGAEPSQTGTGALGWSGDDALLLAQNGQGETLVIIAPDQVTLQAVRAVFPDF